jgi:predicted dehydrogenase
MKKQWTRRTFLETTAATAAAGWSVAQLYAADGKLYGVKSGAAPGPNETINVGLIGCGTRGGQLVEPFLAVPGVRIAAVCDLNSQRMADLREKAGGPKVAAHHDYRKLLDDKTIDAVVVATNGHWKALCDVHACQAGKDVYTEKPLASSIGEGRAIVEAAKKYKRIVQIGTQQHSSDHYRKAAEIVQSGLLGRIGEVKVWDYINQNPGVGAPPDSDPPEELDWDFWLGPSPKVSYNRNRYLEHYWFFDYGGGWTTDWAVHHYDIVHWAMGTRGPLAAYGGGGHYYFGRDADNRDWPDTFSGTLEYGPCPAADRGFVLQYTARCGNQHDNYPASNGKCFYGTDATLLVHRGGCWLAPEIRASKKVEKQVVAQDYDSTAKHVAAFIRNLRNRTQPETDAEVGHRASIAGHLMNIAWRVGRKVHWNADTAQIPDDAEANALVTKQYREPWKLEV